MQFIKYLCAWFRPFPILRRLSLVDSNGKMQIADLLAVDIDLETKKMVKCKMDGENLAPSEALVLLWYNTMLAQQVKH